MRWKDQECNTYGELFDQISTITDPEEVAEFKELYVADTARQCNISLDEAERICDSNIGYLIGYCGGSIDPKHAERRQELHDRWSAKHPIFGDADGAPAAA